MAVTFVKKPKPSSNKTQTPAKTKSTTAEGHDGSSIFPFIDKLSVRISIADEDRADVYNSFWPQIEDKSVFNDTGYKAKKGYKAAKFISLKVTDQRPLIQFDYEDKLATLYRLEFNPRKLTTKGFIELDGVLTSLMPGGWDYVVTHGRISRIDIAVDIPNSRPGMFSVLPKQALTTQKWSSKGKTQTVVHGLKKGNQLLVYNKKAKRLSQGKKWLGGSAVRIECHILSPSLNKLSALGSMQNPFAKFTIVDLVMPPATEKAWLWDLFKDSVTVRGLTAALALLPEAKRTMYRAHLKAHPHDLWKPSAFWSNWPKFLSDFGIDTLHG